MDEENNIQRPLLEGLEERQSSDAGEPQSSSSGSKSPQEHGRVDVTANATSSIPEDAQAAPGAAPAAPAAAAPAPTVGVPVPGSMPPPPPQQRGFGGFFSGGWGASASGGGSGGMAWGDDAAAVQARLAEVTDPRAEWARLRGRMLCLLVVSALNCVVPGSLSLVVAVAGVAAAVVYLAPRVAGSWGLVDAARFVKACCTCCAIISGLSIATFIMLLLAVCLSSNIEEEEEEAYHEGVRQLVVLLMMIVSWHGSVCWLCVSIRRAAARVLHLSNPVSSGVLQV